MPSYQTPPLPIPEPLRGLETGTFAHYSIVVRLVDMVKRTIQENEFPPQVVERLEQLMTGIPDAPIRPLQDPGAPDAAGWDAYVAPYTGQSWLEPPWFFIENYFFRRILEATGYYQPGPGFRTDPFLLQKRLGLETAEAGIASLVQRLAGWLEADTPLPEALVPLIYSDLWGNQADYSLWPAGGKDKPDHASLKQAQEHLLVDDAPQASAYLAGCLAAPPGIRVDFLVDNAGFELVGDLCLADFLITRTCPGPASVQVWLHLKIHPTFVSDATSTDVQHTIAWLQSSETPEVRKLGIRLAEHLAHGRLALHPHPFWTSPVAGWEFPSELKSDLSGAALVISKGDANYRRLLGDRHWPFTLPFAPVVRYFPAPLLALRTLKSEVTTGLSSAQVEELNRKDPKWLTSGRWGLVQFAPHREHE